ncbi:multidrug ABC transporter ATP-binding protein [Bacteroidota bacterium]|nr:multidrug ABC transporter ATP-binding protein [Bacteroidota bacterium]
MSANKSEGETIEKPKFSKEKLHKNGFIFRYLIPYRFQFILGLLVLSAGSILFLVIMKLPGEVFNILDKNPNYSMNLNQLFLTILLLLAFQSILSYFRIRLFAIVSEKSMASLRKDLFKNMVSLPIPWIEDQRVGELTSRITNDVTQIQGALATTVAEFLRQIIILVGGIIFIIFAMPRLALIMLGTFPLVVFAAMYFGKHIRKFTKERQDELAQTNVVVEETMQNIRTVKAFTNEWFELGRYASHLNKVVTMALKAATMRGLFASFIVFVMFGALFFIMWQAALMVENGSMVKGDLVNFIIFTGIIGGAIASLGTFYTELIAALGAGERIVDILQMPGERNIDSPKPISKRFHGKIDFNQVFFAYPSRPEKIVLKGIDISVSPGERIALVGMSGAGKSTLTQLLMQFYKADKGEIFIDDFPISEYDLSDVRGNMAIVPQDVMLFGGSIKDNIAYGNPSASDSDIMEAAKKANAREFIEGFPSKMETIVGERGVKLSGGQKQRVAIARAILKDPAILILDEATSSLDAESERLVQEALQVLMVGRTSIIIAHRLATIKDVNQIYVLENGIIAENGTHQELLQNEKGLYTSLAKLQFEY